MEASLQNLTAADVMLAGPKTLRADTTVADAREMLANEHVQMLLLADDGVFGGAVTSIPVDADPSSPALLYADPDPETIAPTEPAEAAYERSKRNPHRRLVVLDEDRTLLGLVCLDVTLTRFCRGGADMAHP